MRKKKKKSSTTKGFRVGGGIRHNLLDHANMRANQKMEEQNVQEPNE